jgi:large subunit ribosomal protein L32e
MRKRRKGWPVSVNIGYGGPKAARGLHPSGYEEVLVYNLDQIEGLSSETQAIRIAHTVGEKKRRDILTRARELGLHVLNPREMKETPLPPEEETEKTEAEKPEKTETEAVSEETEEEKEKTEQ